MAFAFLLVFCAVLVLGIKHVAARTAPTKVLAGKHAADAPAVTERAKHVVLDIIHRLDAIMGIELVHCLITAGAVFGWFGRGEH